MFAGLPAAAPGARHAGVHAWRAAARRAVPGRPVFRCRGRRRSRSRGRVAARAGAPCATTSEPICFEVYAYSIVGACDGVWHEVR